MSPELLKSIQSKESRSLKNINRFKNDVFCLGLTIMELGLLKSLTKVITKDKIFDFTQLNQYYEEFKKEYKNNKLLVALVKAMTEINSQERPSFIGEAEALHF